MRQVGQAVRLVMMCGGRSSKTCPQTGKTPALDLLVSSDGSDRGGVRFMAGKRGRVVEFMALRRGI